MIIENLKFYADTPKGEKNKPFCWRINSIMDLEERLKYWMSKMYIRSAWYECSDTDTGEITNQRIDITHFTDNNEVIFKK